VEALEPAYLCSRPKVGYALARPSSKGMAEIGAVAIAEPDRDIIRCDARFAQIRGRQPDTDFVSNFGMTCFRPGDSGAIGGGLRQVQSRLSRRTESGWEFVARPHVPAAQIRRTVPPL
jgi:hypothetical protein